MRNLDCGLSLQANPTSLKGVHKSRESKALEVAKGGVLCNAKTSLNMNRPLQPIYLLADSYLLFWRDEANRLLSSIRELISDRAPKAAYIGASNGDDLQFYAIFEAAMEGVGVRDCRMILSSFSADDRDFLNEADLILLAGGDVQKGWRVLKEVGIGDFVLRRYSAGAVLVGVSAGAVQLGLYGLIEAEDSFNVLIDTFKLVPFMVGAHEEKQDWAGLRRAVELLDGSAIGIGIPAGGGLVYHPDRSIEAIRHPVFEISMSSGLASDNLLFPTWKPKE